MNRVYPCVVQERTDNALIVLICLSAEIRAVVQTVYIFFPLDLAKSCLLGDFYANQLQVPFYDEVQP